jgi:hypothetical protein
MRLGTLARIRRLAGGLVGAAFVLVSVVKAFNLTKALFDGSYYLSNAKESYVPLSTTQEIVTILLHYSAIAVLLLGGSYLLKISFRPRA